MAVWDHCIPKSHHYCLIYQLGFPAADSGNYINVSTKLTLQQLRGCATAVQSLLAVVCNVPSPSPSQICLTISDIDIQVSSETIFSILTIRVSLYCSVRQNLIT